MRITKIMKTTIKSNHGNKKTILTTFDGHVTS